MALPLGTFPASLSERHREGFRKRGISPEFAIESGCRTLADNEARDLNFQASLPIDERSKGLQGILFTYRTLDGSRDPNHRLKPDLRFSLNGKQAKYLSRKGDPLRPYFPSTTLPDHAANAKINVIITEGEFKTLSLAENIVPVCSRKTCVIGLQGVNSGWHRDKITITRPDGTKEDKKEGHPHLVDELETWEWAKRVVYICFDSDVGSEAQAAEFKKNKRLGAMGAEHTLVQLLRARGADVRIVDALMAPRNRAQQKKQLEKIVRRIRDNSIGRTDYSTGDFIGDVKCACARERILFDNDLFNQLVS